MGVRYLGQPVLAALYFLTIVLIVVSLTFIHSISNNTPKPQTIHKLRENCPLYRRMKEFKKDTSFNSLPVLFPKVWKLWRFSGLSIEAIKLFAELKGFLLIAENSRIKLEIFKMFTNFACSRIVNNI